MKTKCHTGTEKSGPGRELARRDGGGAKMSRKRNMSHRVATASGLIAFLGAEVGHAQLIVDYQNLAEQNVTRYGETLAKSGTDLFKASSSSSKPAVVHETILKSGIKECDPTVTQHSGYIAFPGHQGTQKSYFFWMFEAKKVDPKTAPLVLWLTGGPGCSSIMALLSENGPCGVDSDGKTLKPNPYSWNTNANVIWVDQPAGTGFSEGDYDHDTKEGVSADMYGFLTGFFEQFPQYAASEFYITGESYAGHYIPAIGHYIFEENKKASKKINLKGLAIGNGLTDPQEQYKWYPEMAYDGGKSRGGSLEKGVITNPITQAIMKGGVTPCVQAIQSCNSGSTAGCMGAFLVCNYAETVPYQFTGMNVYDMRIKCEVPPLCYDFSQVTTFLNDKDVQEKLGAKGKWASCNMMVNALFRADYMVNFQELIPEMLAGGIKVLVYAGDVDYICNWLGNKAWTLKLDWPGKEQFNAAADADYVVEGKAAGRLRSYQNFSFLQVYQAGHMVPMDQPTAALQMLDDFISGKFRRTSTGTAAVEEPASTSSSSFKKLLKRSATGAKTEQQEVQELYN
ncbi:unnamed protein product [Amoebophrya sp. A120]|nr:unnamed protein product [Amoebophrya sp. A120]|eukprot:GSA120T00006405001.1